MPPKTVFSTNDDKFITEIFDMRIESGWSNKEIERQFQHKTNRKLSYKTLYNRYNVLISFSRNVNDQLYNIQPGTSASFATQVNLNEQAIVSMNDHEPVANCINLQDEVQAVNSNINTTPIQRRRGRPVGSGRRRRRTPVNIDGVPPPNRENPRFDQQVVNQIRNSPPIESENVISTRNLRERIRRRNQIPEVFEVETNPQHSRDPHTPIVAGNNSKITRSNRDLFRRDNESPEQRQIRLNIDAEQHRERRANETPSQSLERLTNDSQRHRERRANETEFELNNRLNNNADRQRDRRASETPGERERRLQYQRDYRARVRENETPEERMERLGLVNERRRQRRLNVPTFMQWNIEQNHVIEIDNQGELELACQHCNALYWPKEVNTNGHYIRCCEGNKIVVPILNQMHPVLNRILNPNNREQRQIFDDFLRNIRQLNSLFGMAAVKSNFDPEDLDNLNNDLHRFNERRNNRLPYLFKIHGAVYYRIPPMFNGPDGVLNLRAAQYLMLDTDRAMVEHMVRNLNDQNNPVSEELVQMLQQMLTDSNPLIQLFLTNREILRRQNEQDPFNVRMWITRFVPQNQNIPVNAMGRRQINDLAVNGEIAAVFSDQDGLPDDGIVAFAQARTLELPLVNIVPQRVNNHMESIDLRNPNCDPLCFPLLFPYGEAGYDARYQHNQVQITTNSRVTLKEFYKHRLHVRQNNPNSIFQMGKLFQEYIVCSWIKIEKNNLQFLRQNQAQLRILDYQGIMDRVNDNFNPEENVGRAFILPSTFEGSDRAMKQHYFDALELVGRFGKADYFITFTSNPNWPELRNTLRIGQNYLSRPDMCSRLYNLKFQEFWNDLNKQHKIGVVEANVRVKEYQKRGLPHDHILLWMRDNDKPNTVEQIDQIICAELPDPIQDPDLFELVTTKMLHGPCLPNSSCMKQFGNRCSKGFPKQFIENTEMRVNNYPLYRRRDNGRNFIVRGHVLDNRFVIPYNPAMLKKFQCHINVEYCGNLASMKYIFNYVCKGNDRVNVQAHGQNNTMPFAANRDIPRDQLEQINRQQNEQHEQIDQNDYLENDNYDVQMNRPNDETDIDQNNGDNGQNDQVNNQNENNQEIYDEIRTYERKRYVSSIEAFDKIIGFKRNEISHTIIRMLIHLENRHNVVFNRNNIEQVANNNQTTMLTDFFQLNVRDPRANEFLYKEIVQRYRFDSGRKRWIERVQLNRAERIIGRIPFIHPNNRELFNLKLLLLHVRGPTSYNYLKTMDGVVYDAFEEAARARNLIENNQQWYTMMEEICRVELPHKIRFLFVTLLYHNNPQNPNALQLWETFKDPISEDYRHEVDDTKYHKSLGHIRYMLETLGKTLADYNLPYPDERGLLWRNRDMHQNNDELTAQQHTEAADNMDQTLNVQQRNAVDNVMEAVLDRNDNLNKSFFLDGPGGTGKTYVLNLMYHRLRQRNLRVISTAFTGIAASLLIGGGQTMHSRFKIPIPTNLGVVSNIQAHTQQAQELRECHMFIVDEASMVSRAMLECVDRLLRDLMQKPNVPFGGKVMLLTGDFRQCCPVSDNENIESGILMCLKNSPLWQQFRQLELTDNVRADPNENEFKNWLMEIGNGRSRVYDGQYMVRLPDRVICRDNIVNQVFGDGPLDLEEQNRLNNAILCPTNKDSLEINEIILERLQGNNYQYLSTTNLLDRETDMIADTDDYPIEQALRMTSHSFPPHQLNIKVGAIVMLVKNWCVAFGLCNGTRMRVVQCNQHSIKCAILTGPQQGIEYVFCRTEFRSNQNDAGVRLKRIQFPFRLSFAMTINKSQGQTFNRVGLLLRRPVFSHGQLYVAASRVRNYESLCILVDTHLFGVNRQGNLRYNGDENGIYTKNVVFREILN